MFQKILLKNHQSPGDIIMLTSAVRDLKRAYPNILIDVDTTAMNIWENNPYITKLDRNDSELKIIQAEYPLIHRSNTSPYHFIHGFRMHLEDVLNIKIQQGDFKGDIHISNLEKKWINQIEEMGIKRKFWIIMAGGKYDFTAKWWNPNEYQKVVDHFKDKILFVQCGEADHFHPRLNGVIDLIGKTDTRQFIRLVYHSSGVLCPVTFAMHLAAAVEMKNNFPINRPCVVLAGGREPAQWEAYPNHRFLSMNGALSCCDNGGCWKSRCVKVGDGDEKDNKDLCIFPEEINFKFKSPFKNQEENLVIPKCLNMIKAEDVIKAIESYYIGGVLNYD